MDTRHRAAGRLDPQAVTCTVISVDASTGAAGTTDGAVRLWDAVPEQSGAIWLVIEPFVRFD
jgi:hypothetical protein